MARYFQLFIMLLVFFSASLSERVIASPSLVPEKRIVEEFQKIPEHWPICSDANWEVDDTPGGVTRGMQRYLSTEMMRLFKWIQCDDPQHLNAIAQERNFSWDFRYGTPRGKGALDSIKIIRIQPPKSVAPNRSIVVVNYENGSDKNLWTRYTLIRENGEWKIDDIALKGYSTEMEEILPSSKSLKIELQAAYKRAEAACLKDPKCRMKIGN